MKSIKVAILLFSLTLHFGAQGEWLDKQGNLIPKKEHIKSSGTLFIQQALTLNKEKVLSELNTQNEPAYYISDEYITRNQLLTGFLSFGGCAANVDGNCDLIMQTRIFKPDGKIYFNGDASEVWVNKMAPPKNATGLGVSYFYITIKDNEPLGKYKVVTKVLDAVNDNSMELISYFNVIEDK